MNGRDEDDLWDENNEVVLDDILETLTIRRQRRDYACDKMLVQKPSNYSKYEFLDAVYNMDQYNEQGRTRRQKIYYHHQDTAHKKLGKNPRKNSRNRSTRE